MKWRLVLAGLLFVAVATTFGFDDSEFGAGPNMARYGDNAARAVTGTNSEQADSGSSDVARRIRLFDGDLNNAIDLEESPTDEAERDALAALSTGHHNQKAASTEVGHKRQTPDVVIVSRSEMAKLKEKNGEAAAKQEAKEKAEKVKAEAREKAAEDAKWKPVSYTAAAVPAANSAENAKKSMNSESFETPAPVLESGRKDTEQAVPPAVAPAESAVSYAKAKEDDPDPPQPPKMETAATGAAGSVVKTAEKTQKAKEDDPKPPQPEPLKAKEDDPKPPQPEPLKAKEDDPKPPQPEPLKAKEDDPKPPQPEPEAKEDDRDPLYAKRDEPDFDAEDLEDEGGDGFDKDEKKVEKELGVDGDDDDDDDDDFDKDSDDDDGDDDGDDAKKASSGERTAPTADDDAPAKNEGVKPPVDPSQKKEENSDSGKKPKPSQKTEEQSTKKAYVSQLHDDKGAFNAPESDSVSSPMNNELADIKKTMKIVGKMGKVSVEMIYGAVGEDMPKKPTHDDILTACKKKVDGSDIDKVKREVEDEAIEKIANEFNMDTPDASKIEESLKNKSLKELLAVFLKAERLIEYLQKSQTRISKSVAQRRNARQEAGIEDRAEADRVGKDVVAQINTARAQCKPDPLAPLNDWSVVEMRTEGEQVSVTVMFDEVKAKATVLKSGNSTSVSDIKPDPCYIPAVDSFVQFPVEQSLVRNSASSAVKALAKYSSECGAPAATFTPKDMKVLSAQTRVANGVQMKLQLDISGKEIEILMHERVAKEGYLSFSIERTRPQVCEFLGGEGSVAPATGRLPKDVGRSNATQANAPVPDSAAKNSTNLRGADSEDLKYEQEREKEEEEKDRMNMAPPRSGPPGSINNPLPPTEESIEQEREWEEEREEARIEEARQEAIEETRKELGAPTKKSSKAETPSMDEMADDDDEDGDIDSDNADRLELLQTDEAAMPLLDPPSYDVDDETSFDDSDINYDNEMDLSEDPAPADAPTVPAPASPSVDGSVAVNQVSNAPATPKISSYSTAVEKKGNMLPGLLETPVYASAGASAGKASKDADVTGMDGDDGVGNHAMSANDENLYTDVTVPDSYDVREKFPHCLPKVRQQGNCGASYAIAAVDVLQARYCISSEGKEVVNLSPETVVTCDSTSNACEGGFPFRTFEFLETVGATTEECNPWTAGANLKCPATCSKDEPDMKEMPKSSDGTGALEPPTGPVTNQPTKIRFHPSSTRYVKAQANAEDTIKRSILMEGPVLATMEFFSDILEWGNKIYEPPVNSVSAGEQYSEMLTSSKPVGSHAVVIVGWGEEQSIPYWIVRNSNGDSFGSDGYFRVRRGVNAANIENFVMWAAPSRPCHDALNDCSDRGVCRGGSETEAAWCECYPGWGGMDCSQKGGEISDMQKKAEAARSSEGNKVQSSTSASTSSDTSSASGMAASVAAVLISTAVVMMM